jgi:hypothetical protein
LSDRENEDRTPSPPSEKQPWETPRVIASAVENVTAVNDDGVPVVS